MTLVHTSEQQGAASYAPCQRWFAGSQPKEWTNSRDEMHIEEDACEAQPHSLHAS